MANLSGMLSQGALYHALCRCAQPVTEILRNTSPGSDWRVEQVDQYLYWIYHEFNKKLLSVEKWIFWIFLRFFLQKKFTFSYNNEFPQFLRLVKIYVKKYEQCAAIAGNLRGKNIETFY